jgi:hypothetical protein
MPKPSIIVAEPSVNWQGWERGRDVRAPSSELTSFVAETLLVTVDELAGQRSFVLFRAAVLHKLNNEGSDSDH